MHRHPAELATGLLVRRIDNTETRPGQIVTPLMIGAAHPAVLFHLFYVAHFGFVHLNFLAIFLVFNEIAVLIHVGLVGRHRGLTIFRRNFGGCLARRHQTTTGQHTDKNKFLRNHIHSLITCFLQYQEAGIFSVSSCQRAQQDRTNWFLLKRRSSRRNPRHTRHESTSAPSISSGK